MASNARLPVSKPGEAKLDYNIGTMSKLKQNRHKNITVNNICQLRSAETDYFFHRAVLLATARISCTRKSLDTEHPFNLFDFFSGNPS